MVNEHFDAERDAVLSRLLDGRGKAADWRALRDLTVRDAQQWDLLIGEASDQDALGEAVGLAADCAESVPADAACGTLATIGTVGRRADRAVRAARLGWLVAACLALGLVSVAVRPREAQQQAGSDQSAGLVDLSKWTPTDFMNSYKSKATQDGTLVAELPQRTVIETRPAPDGKGYEVLYIRQFIERAVVDDVYKLGSDETGRPVMVPTAPTTTRPAGAM